MLPLRMIRRMQPEAKEKGPLTAKGFSNELFRAVPLYPPPRSHPLLEDRRKKEIFLNQETEKSFSCVFFVVFLFRDPTLVVCLPFERKFRRKLIRLIDSVMLITLVRDSVLQCFCHSCRAPVLPVGSKCRVDEKS